MYVYIYLYISISIYLSIYLSIYIYIYIMSYICITYDISLWSCYRRETHDGISCCTV